MISRGPFRVNCLRLLIFLSSILVVTSQDHSATFEVEILSARNRHQAFSGSLNLCLKHYQKKFIPNEECYFGNQSLPYPGKKKASFDFFEKLPDDFTLAISFLNQSNGVRVYESTTGLFMPSEEWTQQTLAYYSPAKRSLATVTLQYRTTCTQNHYGRYCNKICIPSIGGSYTCGPRGERICQPGYYGPMCDQRCSSTCKNGVCDTQGACRCLPGWAGPFCDQCQTSPGCSAGTCQLPGECKCLPGFGGKNCTEPTSLCSGFCKNGGTCNIFQSRPVCTCPPGFTGPQCESRISTCDKNPCKNNGSCKNDNTTHAGFVCECPEGFVGQFCQTRAKTCFDHPCMNGANCIDNHRGFYCECTNNWEGQICDIPLTFCRADSCLNEGECQHAPSTARGFTCKCAPGFYGESCEKKILDWKVCKNYECQNGGSCYRNKGRPACSCPEGFGGDRCEVDLAPCDCLNGGVCRKQSSKHECMCLQGFYGEKCQMKVNPFELSETLPPSSHPPSRFPLWQFLIFGLIFLIISSLITFLPKYCSLRKSPTPVNPDLLPHSDVQKHIELPMSPSSFCHSAPSIPCHHHSSPCICQASTRRTVSENQYTLEPTVRPPTPEALREAAKRMARASQASPKSFNSHGYEELPFSRGDDNV